MRELVAAMYRYNDWANQRVLDTPARLSPEQYRADGGTSFGSVHDTLVHIIGAQWIWLSRWKGTDFLYFIDVEADLAPRRSWRRSPSPYPFPFRGRGIRRVRERVG